MKDIVIFTIGPVQSYISAARRTQDLWAGSRLLSDVMKAALDAAGGVLVFPTRAAGSEWPDSLPNRAVAVAVSGEGAAVADDMARAARARWEAVAGAVRDWFGAKVKAPDGPWDWREIWKRQVKDWLEVYWIAYPWNDATESYGAAYRRASALLDARKLTRHFPDHCEDDMKSTLDGAYQALRGREEDKAYTAKAFWEEAARKAPRGDVRRGERLSAIDLIKRFAQDAEQLGDNKTRFPSTSSIACADYRLELMRHWSGKLDEEGNLLPDTKGTEAAVTAFVAALDALIDAFPSKEQDRLRFSDSSHEPIPLLQKKAAGKATLFQLGRYDGDYYYPDFYSEARFIDQVGREPGAKLTETERKAVRNAKEALRQLYDCTDSLGIPRPALYYAVIALDGDQVGKKLSHADVTQDHHQAVSQAMNTFARQDVPRIAGQQHPALWVYAGGDDALVLSPVSYALAVADTLRKAFAATVGAELNKINPDTRATASAGIAIVHQQNPLQAGIRRAKTAEEAAKSKPYDRNALVIHRLTRGGTPLLVGSNWDVDHNGATHSIVGQIIALQGHIATGRLSGKFAYELRDEAAALAAVKPDGWKAELARLMERHTPEKGNRPQIRNVAEQLADLAASLREVKARGKNDGEKGIEQVAEWAVLARFLATGGRRS